MVTLNIKRLLLEKDNQTERMYVSALNKMYFRCFSLCENSLFFSNRGN